MMLSGCASNIRTNTYRFRSSYAARNSVLSDGAESIRGWNCRKSEKRGALCQTASSSRPSIEGGCVARMAIAVAGGDCDSVFGCWDDATIDSAQSAEMAADGLSITGSGQRCPIGQRIPEKGWDARVRESRPEERTRLIPTRSA